MAEEEGFEPPEPFSSTVFKTAALNRSATPPYGDDIREHEEKSTKMKNRGFRYRFIPGGGFEGYSFSGHASGVTLRAGVRMPPPVRLNRLTMGLPWRCQSLLKKLADGGGFEPPVSFYGLRRFSKPLD